MEEQLVLEYLNKQKNNPGIKSLGNEIRRNKIVNDVFNTPTADNKILIKLTAHYQSYVHTILSNLYEHKNKELYCFVFDERFRSISQLVDSTSKGANFIYDILELLNNNFKPNNKNFDFIYIFEMYGFEDFHIVDNSGYSKLIQIT